MASIYDNIRTALETELASISGIPDIAWENVSYSPTTGTSFVRPQLMPTVREPAHRGVSPQMYYQGIYRITCFVDENKGPGAADDLADSIIEAFEATTDISNGGTTVSISYAEREMGTNASPWYQVPVNIGWYIYS
jgi:hypothetical protein